MVPLSNVFSRYYLTSHVSEISLHCGQPYMVAHNHCLHSFYQLHDVPQMAVVVVITAHVVYTVCPSLYIPPSPLFC